MVAFSSAQSSLQIYLLMGKWSDVWSIVCVFVQVCVLLLISLYVTVRLVTFHFHPSLVFLKILYTIFMC